MTFSAQLMNGFGIAFKPLVIFTPHFPAILENSGLAWKTTALLHFRHPGKTSSSRESIRRYDPFADETRRSGPGRAAVDGASPPYRACGERKAFALPGFSTKTNPLVSNGAVHRRPVFRF
ncbi:MULTISPECIES: hypothetical protein [unclassified Agrobacterium]|uniref:hypothetical protein n=1 Tax=unclassified Agrobacterium TaxID=2632611 RepID=UPI001483A11B|nr:MULTISPECIES: hypothetical protein [unclassified Agrobacterium]